MTDAIQKIVDGYRAVGDWAALEGLHAHRTRLRQQLEEKRGGALDISQSIRTMDNDLKVIETALSASPARQSIP
jgi:hypothetical protein